LVVLTVPPVVLRGSGFGKLEFMVMIFTRIRGILLPALAIPLLTACVSQGKYDAVVSENQQLQAQNQQL